ncbi:MAG: Acylphosphate phosphohydrolase, putative, partial [uncultured Rubrobacteraceae bacterium]
GRQRTGTRNDLWPRAGRILPRCDASGGRKARPRGLGPQHRRRQRGGGLRGRPRHGEPDGRVVQERPVERRRRGRLHREGGPLGRPLGLRGPL